MTVVPGIDATERAGGRAPPAAARAEPGFLPPRRAAAADDPSLRTVAATFLFAGGGSGGHVAPGLAVAERLAEIAPMSRSLFVCSGRPIDSTMLAEAGVRFEPIDAAPVGLAARPVRFARGFLSASAASRRMIRAARVDRVVALGGFVAPPVVVAATICGVPVTLMSLDARPGLATRWLSPLCDQVLCAVEVEGRRRFRHVVGMPLRRAALAPAEPAACREALGLRPRMPTLLVTGASQGARSLDAMMRALLDSRSRTFDGWQVLHLSGQADPGDLERAYRDAGVPAVVEPFLHLIGLAWGSADLALSRAGASSVAEAWANAVPTLFMPYPHHRDMHQQRNARPMADTGGAVIELDRVDGAANAQSAGRTLLLLMEDPDWRAAMRARLLATAPTDAADRIARILLASV